MGMTHIRIHKGSVMYVGYTRMYVGESNENLESVMKIQNTARLSCKFTTVILMV